MSLAVEGQQPFFDDVVDHLAAICAAPIAIVVLNKLHRQWVSGQGAATGNEVDVTEVFDARALMGPDKAVVTDTRASKTFPSDSRDAQRSQIRSFIAQPMRHHGELAGHIYLADTKPREWTPAEIAYLERAERLLLAQVEACTIIIERDRSIALEAELSDIGRLHGTIVANLTEGVAVMDGTGQIIATNPAARQMLDLSEEEFHSRTPMNRNWRFLGEDGQPISNDQNVSLVALRTGKPQLGVALGVNRPSGEIRWLMVNAVPLLNPGDDHPHRVISTFRDITEDRVRDAELKRALAEAERAAESKQQFLANMSHEIRTPLNGVVGLAQALKMTKLDAEQEDLVATILDSGATLMALLNDVLDLSKIEAGRFQIVRTEQNVGEFLRLQSQLWRCRAEEKGLRLSVSIDADMPETLSFDAVRVQQCLNNLLSNAVKFTSSGEVSLLLASRRLNDGEHMVEVRVRDTGIGMDEIALARLFQPFTQADESISLLHGGTGLGLSITRKLAELMGGQATATSRPGGGSEFVVSFRASPCISQSARADAIASADAAQAESDHIRARQLRVLVVDDNAVNRQVAVLFLKPLGAAFIEATNGEEALAALEAERFDLVLLDMHMPVLDGPGTIARIRASKHAWSSTPVIAVTADAMSGDRERYLALGMDGYLPKPLGARELMSEISSVTDITIDKRLAMTG